MKRDRRQIPEPAQADDGAHQVATTGKKPQDVSHTSKRPDLAAAGLAMAVVGVVLTYAQLTTARAVMAVLTIVLLLVTFLLNRHVHRPIAKWTGVAVSGALALAAFVSIQLFPADSAETSPVTRPAVITTTLTVAPASSAPQSSSPTASAMSTPPSPANSVPPATATIGQSETQSFFGGALRVGVTSVESTYASLTVATAAGECGGYPDPGESLVIHDGWDRWYRVVVVRLKGGSSVTVEVTQGSGDGPAGQTCV